MPSVKTQTPEYRAWIDMRRRANFQNLAPAWLNNFDAFLKDVGQKPGPDYNLLRKDASKPHGPGNTFWASPEEKRQYKWQGTKRNIVPLGELPSS